MGWGTPWHLLRVVLHAHSRVTDLALATNRGPNFGPVASIGRCVALRRRTGDNVHPPAPQGAVPRTHQAHQDQLGISLAEPVLEAVHWRTLLRPTASQASFPLSLRCTRHAAPSMSISATYHAPRSRSGGLGQGKVRVGRPPPTGPGWGAGARAGLRGHDHDFPLVI